MKWELTVRPPSNVCPEVYCFHWASAGDLTAPPGRRYASVREALKDIAMWKTWEVGGCACSRGPCKRQTESSEAPDHYEPCEPRLERDGLPWFYFTTLASLRDDFHAEFIRGAVALWGEAALVEITDPPFLPGNAESGEKGEEDS